MTVLSSMQSLANTATYNQMQVTKERLNKEIESIKNRQKTITYIVLSIISLGLVHLFTELRLIELDENLIEISSKIRTLVSNRDPSNKIKKIVEHVCNVINNEIAHTKDRRYLSYILTEVFSSKETNKSVLSFNISCDLAIKDLKHYKEVRREKEMQPFSQNHYRSDPTFEPAINRLINYLEDQKVKS